MANPTIIIIRNQPGNPEPDGTPSVQFDVSFRVPCPSALKDARPVTVTVNGANFESLFQQTVQGRNGPIEKPATMDPNATQQEIAALVAGDMLEFFVPAAGGQIPVPDGASGDANAWAAFRGILDTIAGQLVDLNATTVAHEKGAGIRWTPIETARPASIFTAIGVPPHAEPIPVEEVAVPVPELKVPEPVEKALIGS